jgi:hypothetical protein
MDFLQSNLFGIFYLIIHVGFLLTFSWGVSQRVKPLWAKILVWLSFLLLGPLAAVLWWKPFWAYVQQIFPVFATPTAQIQTLTSLPMLKLETVAPTAARTFSSEALLATLPNLTSPNALHKLLGSPTRISQFSSGYVVNYPSSRDGKAHSILFTLDPLQIKCVAVCNTDPAIIQFTGFEEQYGSAKLVAEIAGNCYWLFPNAPLALITKGKQGKEILYLQYFSHHMTLEEYYENNAYHRETFAQ